MNYFLFLRLDYLLLVTDSTAIPVSKTKNFTIEEQEIALLGRALAHPKRVRILSVLN